MNERERIARVITSVPANAVARDVTETEGEHWDARVPSHVPHFTEPPPMRPVPPDAADVVGKKFGRLTVIGAYVKRHPKKGTQWVCRCTCGSYELRCSQALLRPRAPRTVSDGDMCAKCDYLNKVRWKYENLPPRNFTKKGEE